MKVYFVFSKICLIFASAIGGIAQLARASALQAEGRRFDSDYLHKKRMIKSNFCSSSFSLKNSPSPPNTHTASSAQCPENLVFSPFRDVPGLMSSCITAFVEFAFSLLTPYNVLLVFMLCHGLLASCKILLFAQLLIALFFFVLE